MNRIITQTKETQSRISPLEALELLKQGNHRYITGNMLKRDLLHQAENTASYQFPFAVILSCVDSRVVPEYIFDQGIGDIIDIRIAGNIVNEDILGSLEFACSIAGAKLILVLGHTNCGAIMGAIDNVEFGNLSSVVKKIKNSEYKVGYNGEKSSANPGYLSAVIKENVFCSIREISFKSAILKQKIDKKEILLSGAMYDMRSGMVEFY